MTGRGFVLCMGEGDAGEVELDFDSPAVYVCGRVRLVGTAASSPFSASISSSKSCNFGTGLRLTELLRRTSPVALTTLRPLLDREMSPRRDIMSLSVMAEDILSCRIAASFQAGTPGNCIASACTTSSESEAWLATVRVL